MARYFIKFLVDFKILLIKVKLSFFMAKIVPCPLGNAANTKETA